MISQLEFDPRDYHLRVMIEAMERDGRPEHAIADAVRAASDPAAESSTTEKRAREMSGHSFERWVRRLRSSGLRTVGGAMPCSRVLQDADVSDAAPTSRTA